MICLRELIRLEVNTGGKMPIKVKFHPEVYKDLKELEEDAAYEEARHLINKLSANPNLGQPLEDREDLGLYLSNFRKIYFYNKKYRIVYTISSNQEILITVISVGKRDYLQAYEKAYERISS